MNENKKSMKQETIPAETGAEITNAEAVSTSEGTPSPGADKANATTTGQLIQNALTGAALPAGYLADGSMVDADGALRPEYIGGYAQDLAGKLSPLKASAFHTAFLKEAKEARKKKVLYGTKKNCVLGMVTQAKKLVHRKKDPAPGVLLEMITAATATVKDPGTFEALYMHLDAIYSYMLE